MTEFNHPKIDAKGKPHFLKQMKSFLEQRHIDNGDQGDPAFCALWQMYNECLPWAERIRVFKGPTLSIQYRGYRVYYKFSRNASGFIGGFDRDKSQVVPGTVTVRFFDMRKISAVQTDRKAQVNVARNARNAARSTVPASSPRGLD